MYWPCDSSCAAFEARTASAPPTRVSLAHSRIAASYLSAAEPVMSRKSRSSVSCSRGSERRCAAAGGVQPPRHTLLVPGERPVSRVLCRVDLRRPGDGHPSERPTRGLSEQRQRPPIRSCSGSSLPRFTPAEAGIVTVALFLASRRTGVTREPALWSSDFPRTRPFDRCARGRPAASRDLGF
jgi:hypothetical protein